MGKEVLAGAVLDLHQQAADESPLRAERDAAIRLLQRTLEIREMGSEGVHKTAIREFLARAGALPSQYRSITRLDRMQTLERDLVSIQPDVEDALRLLQAWYRGVEDRHGKGKTTDLRSCVNDVEEALGELEAAELTR